MKRPRAGSDANEAPVDQDRLSLGESKMQEAVERLTSKIKALDEHIADKVCRICFGGDESLEPMTAKERRKQKDKKRDENPLLMPCNCTGSSRFIHLSCLNQWLERSRTEYQYDDCATTIYKISSCELCNTKYPDKINIKGEIYEIFKVSRPLNYPYLLLEVLGMPDGKNLKLITVPRDKVVVLGRSEDCDLVIND